MLFLFALLPILSPIFCYLLPDNKKIIFYVGLLLSIIALGATSILGYWSWITGTHVNFTGNWLHLSDAFTLQINFTSDLYSSLLAFVTVLLTLLIYIYSYDYLEHEIEFKRFSSTFLTFCGSMVGLVYSTNLIQLFFFWEGIGLCSFLLIGFWHEQEKARNSSLQAFLYNRFGDVFLLSGILWLGIDNGSYDLMQLLDSPKQSFGTLLIFVGAMAKSAQFPLHIWLPNAMTGPTPVSALLHSATLVAAGVFLTIRIYPLMNADVRFIVLIIGSITALTGAFLAFREHDFKRIWAYSSMSQLGLMMCGIGFGYPEMAYFHLITHAFFKSSLFLGTGIILHHLEHQAHHNHAPFSSDIRLMGGLIKKIPIIFIIFIFASSALIGLPLTSGFLSKEGLLMAGLQWTLEHPKQDRWLLIFPIVLMAVTFLTATYVTKTLILVFFGKSRSFNLDNNGSSVKTPILQPSSFAMTSIFIICSSFSIGLLFNPFNVFNTEQAWIIEKLHPEASFEFGKIATLGSLTAIVSGMLIAWIGFGRKINQPLPEIILPFHRIKLIRYLNGFFRKVEFGLNDFFIEKLFVRPILKLAHFLHHSFDRNIIDSFVVGISKLIANFEIGGVNFSISAQVKWIDEQVIDGLVRGLAHFTQKTTGIVRNVQLGIIQFYFLITFLLLIGIFIWVIF